MLARSNQNFVGKVWRLQTLEAPNFGATCPRNFTKKLEKTKILTLSTEKLPTRGFLKTICA